MFLLHVFRPPLRLLRLRLNILSGSARNKNMLKSGPLCDACVGKHPHVPGLFIYFRNATASFHRWQVDIWRQNSNDKGRIVRVTRNVACSWNNELSRPSSKAVELFKVVHVRQVHLDASAICRADLSESKVCNLLVVHKCTGTCSTSRAVAKSTFDDDSISKWRGSRAWRRLSLIDADSWCLAGRVQRFSTGWLINMDPVPDHPAPVVVWWVPLHSINCALTVFISITTPRSAARWQLSVPTTRIASLPEHFQSGNTARHCLCPKWSDFLVDQLRITDNVKLNELRTQKYWHLVHFRWFRAQSKRLFHSRSIRVSVQPQIAKKMARPRKVHEFAAVRFTWLNNFKFVE